MKIIYLLPPSEGKNTGGNIGVEKLSFPFEKPVEIAINATQKDLKCTGVRYEQGIELNKKLFFAQLPHPNPLLGEEREQAAESQDKMQPFSPSKEKRFRDEGIVLPAIERYSGVMYNAIDYDGMLESGKKYFDKNFIILSGMYGLVKSLDTIGNYKLPIETKGLYKFWGNSITQALDNIKSDYIVDMLPGAYAKMIDWKTLKTPRVQVNFLHQKDGELKKITHGVKKVKGEYVKNLCEKGVSSLEKLEGEKVQISENEYHIQVISK